MDCRLNLKTVSTLLNLKFRAKVRVLDMKTTSSRLDKDALKACVEANFRSTVRQFNVFSSTISNHLQ